MCKVEMSGMIGCKGHEQDQDYGFSLYCLNKKCASEEVFGHGKNEDEAYRIVILKYGC